MKGHLKTIIGVGLSVLLLGWVLRDVSPGEVVRELRSADPLLYFLGVAINFAGLVIRAVRWGILLRPLGAVVPFGARFATVTIGFAVNNVLPARVGEFARALALSRVAPVTIGASFATLVLERIFDAVAIITLLFVVMAGVNFPATGEIGGIDPRSAAKVFAVLMGGVGVVLFVMVFAPHPFVRLAERVVAPLPERFSTPLLAALHSFLGGLGALRSAPLFILSAVLAFFQWWFTAWGFYVTALAFGITEVPLHGAVFLQSLIALAVAIPSSPGFFGPFEAFAKIGLGLWGVTADKAVSFAVGLHLGSFIPVTLLGLYYINRLNLSWRDMRQSEEVVEDRVEHPPVSDEAP